MENVPVQLLQQAAPNTDSAVGAKAATARERQVRAVCISPNIWNSPSTGTGGAGGSGRSALPSASSRYSRKKAGGGGYVCMFVCVVKHSSSGWLQVSVVDYHLSAHSCISVKATNSVFTYFRDTEAR